MRYRHIAIFGGSFDPPHLGHMGIIDSVLKHFSLDKLIVLVAYRNPFKVNVRLEPMMRLSCMQKLIARYDRVECSDYEIAKNQPIQSVESILHFWNLYKPQKLYFIIGEDNLEKLPTWGGFDIFRKITDFIVLSRNIHEEFNASKYDDFANRYEIALHYVAFSYDISSSDIVSDIDRYKHFIPAEIRGDVIRSLRGV